MSKLRDLPNVGSRLECELLAAGIETPEQLATLGAVGAACRLNAVMAEPCCTSRLCALEGAIRGVRWHDLDKTLRDRLKDEYRRALET